MLAPDTAIGGRYRVLRTIGRGGMGVVYEVEHLRTGQHLALKVLLSSSSLHADASPEGVERFKREARASGSIKSEHVVRITDADVAAELGGSPYYVMELLEGLDLSAATHGGPASKADVVEWLRQAARGLSRAHDLGIVHRDLKPENLFLTQRDDGAQLVKILDFGIAKSMADATAHTQSGQIIGTPLFMSPEQALAGTVPITTKTDLYALGLIAFRLLTGEYYWRDGTLAVLVRQILYDPMEPPTKRHPELGEAFDAWFLRACARDPAERFETAPAQVEALAKALGLASRESGAEPSGNARAVITDDFVTAKTLEAATPAPARTLDSAVSAISGATPAPPKSRRWIKVVLVAAAIAASIGFLATRDGAPGAPGAAGTPPSAPSGLASIASAPSVLPASVEQPAIASASESVPAQPVPSTIASAAPKASTSAPAPAHGAKSKPGATPDPLADQK